MSNNNSFLSIENRKWLVDRLLNGSKNDGTNKGIGDVMSSIFSINASGINGNSIGDGRIFAEFAKRNCYQASHEPVESEHRHYFYSQLGTVIERLMDYGKVEDDEQLLETLCAFHKLLKDQGISNQVFIYLYDILLDNWNLLSGWTYTYRLLMSMSSLQAWVDTNNERMTLVELLE